MLIYAMWVFLRWICVLGGSMMDLGGDLMVESNREIDSWVMMPSLCGSAAPYSSYLLLAEMLCL
jgi:hypothetical protein